MFVTYIRLLVGLTATPRGELPTATLATTVLLLPLMTETLLL